MPTIAKRVVGLDIDLAKIKAAEVVRKGRNRLVTRLAMQTLPSGAIVDGKVRSSSDLIQGLEALLKAADFNTDSVVLGVRSPWVTVKTHKMPAMPKRELEKAIEYELPELVSFPIPSMRDVCYDFFVNSETEQEMEVVIVACQRKNLDPYIEVMRQVGLTLEGIDVPSFGWGDLLRDGKRRAYVEASDGQTTVQVILDGVFKVLRMVPLGMAHLREGVQEAFQCSAEQAQELCQKHNLDYLLLEGTGSKRLLRAAVQQFTGSILQTLDFVRAQERAASFPSMLDEIVLIGDFADLEGLSEMLKRELGLNVTTLREQELRLEFQIQAPGRFNCFGSALALGLRGLEM